jgi:hypothetical protein
LDCIIAILVGEVLDCQTVIWGKITAPIVQVTLHKKEMISGLNLAEKLQLQKSFC